MGLTKQIDASEIRDFNPRLETKKPYQEVSDRILFLIESGIYPAGSRLPNERKMAEEFNVSRAILRNAIAILRSQGRIETKQGSGTYVLPSNRRKITGLPYVGELELTEARLAFESESAALAAMNITDDVFDELQRYIDIMSGKTRSQLTPDQADKAFHLAIAKATNNDAIELFVTSLWNMRENPTDFRKKRGTIYDDGFDDRIAEHQAILEALKNRNSLNARLAMRTHCTQVREKYIKA